MVNAASLMNSQPIQLHKLAACRSVVAPADSASTAPMDIEELMENVKLERDFAKNMRMMGHAIDAI